MSSGDYSVRSEIDRSYNVTSQALLVTKYVLIVLLVILIATLIYLGYDKLSNRIKNVFDDTDRKNDHVDAQPSPSPSSLSEPQNTAARSPQNTRNVGAQRRSLPKMPSSEILRKSPDVPLGILNSEATANNINALETCKYLMPALAISQNAPRLTFQSTRDSVVPIAMNNVVEYRYPYDESATFDIGNWDKLTINGYSSSANLPKLNCRRVSYGGQNFVVVYTEYAPLNGVLDCGLIISTQIDRDNLLFSVDEDTARIVVFGGAHGFRDNPDSYKQTLIVAKDIKCRLPDKTTLSLVVSSIVLTKSDQWALVLKNMKKLLFGNDTDCFEFYNGRMLEKNKVIDASGRRQNTKAPKLRKEVAIFCALSVRMPHREEYDSRTFLEQFKNSPLADIFSLIAGDNFKLKKILNADTNVEEVFVDVFFVDVNTAKQTNCIERLWDGFDLASINDPSRNYIKSLTLRRIDGRNVAGKRTPRSSSEFTTLEKKIMEDGEYSDAEDSESIYGTTRFVHHNILDETSSVSTIQSTTEDDNVERNYYNEENADLEQFTNL